MAPQIRKSVGQAVVFLKQGDPTPEQIYTSVGWALSCWEIVETACWLCSQELRRWTSGLAREIYASQPSSASKQKLVGLTTEYVFHNRPIHLIASKHILNLVSKFADRRNDIAHGSAVASARSGSALGFHWEGPYHQGRGFDTEKSEPKYSFVAENILQFGRYFDGLSLSRYLTWSI